MIIHYFKTTKGEIFSCSFNIYGQCGSGHFHNPQITPSHILNVPPNIIHFVCGDHQTLFSIQKEMYFQLGLMIMAALVLVNTNQNELNKLLNIPPKIISCVDSSCYLIDFEGNLWTFGYNE